MKLISAEKKENNIVELEASVSPEELKAAIDKVFIKKSKTISVPGFRKGKAPRSIIERMYGKDIFLEDAVNEIYPQAYSDAVEEAKIEPVDRADIDITSASVDGGFTFKAKVTVKPEVELGEYKGVKADKIIYSVTDEAVDSEIDRMRERNARIISSTENPAKDGDEVVINFEGFVDGKAFEGGKAEDYNITLGSHSFIDNFEQQIEGHNVGDEFDVNVSFPEDYHAEELKGKPALFKVKLTDIKAKELPELDDEFAKDVSEFDTVAELKADIRQKMEQAGERRTAEEFENTILDEIIKDMKAEIPACMVDARVGDMARDFEQRISQQGMNINMYLQYTGMTKESFLDSFKEQAGKQVKVRLALEKIAELEKLEASEEDITKEYEKISETYNMPMDNIRKLIPEKEIASDIKSQKAIDFVRDNAVASEKQDESEKETAKKPAAKKTAKKSEKTSDTNAQPDEADAEAKPKKEAKPKAAKKPKAEPKTEEEEKPAE